MFYLCLGRAPSRVSCPLRLLQRPRHVMHDETEPIPQNQSILLTRRCGWRMLTMHIYAIPLFPRGRGWLIPPCRSKCYRSPHYHITTPVPMTSNDTINVSNKNVPSTTVSHIWSLHFWVPNSVPPLGAGLSKTKFNLNIWKSVKQRNSTLTETRTSHGAAKILIPLIQNISSHPGHTWCGFPLSTGIKPCMYDFVLKIVVRFPQMFGCVSLMVCPNMFKWRFATRQMETNGQSQCSTGGNSHSSVTNNV